MYNRLENLIDCEKLANKNILLVGVGGVGSFCFETLIRSGIKNITIIDYDKYDITNLNRQLHSKISNIGKSKVSILKEYAKDINNDINVNAIDTFLDENNKIDFSKYDFVIDACDSLKTKVFLVEECYENNIKIITSLGVGNRINPKSLKISKLSKTYNDPLAKKMRASLKKNHFSKDINVLFSEELPIKKLPISSYMGTTSVAGILIADYVIKELLR